MNFLFTLFFAVFFISTSIVFFFVALVIKVTTFLLDKRLLLLHRFTQFWASMYLKINPFWKIRISNKERIIYDQPCIYVSNHQSNFDILAVSALQIPFKSVAKETLFKVPFIGWNMSLNNYISIKRGDRRSIVEMMKKCYSLIEKGNSIFMFPEGTRSETGEIQSFKSGAFLIAKKKNLPIIPIVLKGTKDIMPKNKNTLNIKSSITIDVLSPILPATYENKDAEEIKKEVEELMREYYRNKIT